MASFQQSFLKRLAQSNSNDIPSLIQTIKSNDWDPNEVDAYGDNALIIACYDERLKDVALELIHSEKIDLGHVNNSGDTALTIACFKVLEDVAIALIETKQSKPDQVNNEGDTALLYACRNKLKDVALELIKTGESRPGQVNNEGDTALMVACEYDLEKVALELIKTGESKPGQIYNNGETALIISCRNALENVALELIKTGESRPEQVTNDKDTALIMACHNELKEVALELIKTGKSKPGQMNNYEETALLVACKNNELEDVAVALLATGETNLYKADREGMSALQYAIQNKFTKLLDALPKDLIDINQTGFNMILQEDVNIQEYLKENPHNVVFLIEGKHYLTSKDVIKQQINVTNVKYGCRRAGNGSRFVMDENIISETPYLTLSTVVPLQILITLEDARKITHPLSANMFILKNTGLKLPAIISEEFIRGGNGVSADHCQPGKETDVYGLFVAAPVCGDNAKVAEKEESNIAAPVPGNEIIIKYKEKEYRLPVGLVNNVEELNNMFLDKLVSQGVVTDKNYKVRLLSGSGFVDDAKLMKIKEDPSNSVIQALINKQNGGNRTKKVKRVNRAKQSKRVKRAKQTKRVKKGKSRKQRKTKRR
jgi:ankyrin repeat protein